MKQEIEIKKYNVNKGLELNWLNGFNINIRLESNEVMIFANREGLISLANHMLTLAQNEVPIGMHIHLDEYNSLEDGSYDLVIEKIE